MNRFTGVRADELTPSGRFWSIVKKVLAGKIDVKKVEWVPPCEMDLFERYPYLND
jgi:hypothetical protein